jgi:hypothetical protein
VQYNQLVPGTLPSDRASVLVGFVASDLGRGDQIDVVAFGTARTPPSPALPAQFLHCQALPVARPLTPPLTSATQFVPANTPLHVTASEAFVTLAVLSSAVGVAAGDVVVRVDTAVRASLLGTVVNELRLLDVELVWCNTGYVTADLSAPASPVIAISFDDPLSTTPVPISVPAFNVSMNLLALDSSVSNVCFAQLNETFELASRSNVIPGDDGACAL